MPQPQDPNQVDSEVVEEPGEPEDKPMSAKQFNQALSAREKAFEKRLAKQQDDFIKMMQGMTPQKTVEEPALSRTAELEKNYKELSTKWQERDARDKSDNLRRLSEQALKANGIDANFTEHALSYLIDAKKSIKYDGDSVVMVVNGVEYDLESGVQAWSQTNDAKLYKKPTGAKGSGDTNRRPSAQEQARLTGGEIELKMREGAAQTFSAHNPKSTLSKDTRAQLQQLFLQKLSK